MQSSMANRKEKAQANRGLANRVGSISSEPSFQHLEGEEYYCRVGLGSADATAPSMTTKAYLRAKCQVDSRVFGILVRIIMMQMTLVGCRANMKRVSVVAESNSRDVTCAAHPVALKTKDWAPFSSRSWYLQTILSLKEMILIATIKSVP